MTCVAPAASQYALLWAEEVVREGEVKPNRVEVLEGGLARIDSERGLKRLAEGKVSGVKLVVRIEETLGF